MIEKIKNRYKQYISESTFSLKKNYKYRIPTFLLLLFLISNIVISTASIRKTGILSTKRYSNINFTSSNFMLEKIEYSNKNFYVFLYNTTWTTDTNKYTFVSSDSVNTKKREEKLLEYYNGMYVIKVPLDRGVTVKKFNVLNVKENTSSNEVILSLDDISENKDLKVDRKSLIISHLNYRIDYINEVTIDKYKREIKSIDDTISDIKNKIEEIKNKLNFSTEEDKKQLNITVENYQKTIEKYNDDIKKINEKIEVENKNIDKIKAEIEYIKTGKINVENEKEKNKNTVPETKPISTTTPQTQPKAETKITVPTATTTPKTEQKTDQNSSGNSTENSSRNEEENQNVNTNVETEKPKTPVATKPVTQAKPKEKIDVIITP